MSNPIKDKSYSFSLKIINLYKLLIKNGLYDIARQILRCGTSIGANVVEANGGQSKADFVAKMQIAYKEALETEYWLNLLHDSLEISDVVYNELIFECKEIIKLLVSILNTSKVSIKK